MNQENLLKYEVMDRAAVILLNIDNTLSCHSGLTKKTRKKLRKAVEAMNALYQVAAAEVCSEEGQLKEQAESEYFPTPDDPLAQRPASTKYRKLNAQYLALLAITMESQGFVSEASVFKSHLRKTIDGFEKFQQMAHVSLQDTISQAASL